jgi:hypothetical protein
MPTNALRESRPSVFLLAFRIFAERKINQLPSAIVQQFIERASSLIR